MIEAKDILVSKNSIHFKVNVCNHVWFKNVYLKSISIYTQDTFDPNKQEYGDNPIWIQYYNNVKSAEEIITLQNTADFSPNTFDKDLFFICVQVTGTPDKNTPCELDKEWTVVIAYYLRDFYNKGISYLKELNQSCQEPKGFIDYILRYKAFQLALKAGDYNRALTYWKDFIKGESMATSNCGCYGNK